MAQNQTTRRSFMGAMVTGLSLAGITPTRSLLAQARSAREALRDALKDPKVYDGMAKLANNENPWGPSEAVMKAMNEAWKYGNRYGYPDGGLVDAIAAHHGLKPENVQIGAGSSELLKMMDDAFLVAHKKVIGVDPTYESVYRYATNSKADAIRIPLLKDYRADIPAIIRAAKLNYRDVGFIYLCNPNNPTGNIIPKQEIKQLLDSIPGDVPVMIDEAYHHFVTSPDYATAVPYVLEGRPVVVCRTFSKIYGLAGLRLGYGLGPKELIERLRPHVMSYNTNALVKHGAVAALKDTAFENKVRQTLVALRNQTTKELGALGYEVMPSETNFFMVNVGRDVAPVAEEFQKRGVLVGRKFPPLDTWLRVSVGNEQEMARFMTAFKEMFPAGGLKAKAESGD
jgi:histidinol-phosphate aminotransferase